MFVLSSWEEETCLWDIGVLWNKKHNKGVCEKKLGSTDALNQCLMNSV